MLRIDMLPAGNGDALWIEYGEEAKPRHILIDGGTADSWDEGLRPRVAALDPAERHFELLIVTHIDADHIDGVLELLEGDLGASFGDVWFNGWRHLPETPLESLGPIEGERLTDLLVAGKGNWNAAFGGRAVAVADDSLPEQTLADGLKLTVLSPDAKRLAALKPVWRKVVEEAGLDPEREREAPAEPLPAALERLGADQLPDVAALAALPFKADTAEANGSSIVVLAEYEGASALLCGDAFPAVVLTAVERLVAARGSEALAVDAFKLPHHGSHANISRDLLARLDCRRYLFSSNGAHTRHPHQESIARVLVTADAPTALTFNYKTRFNEVWGDAELSAQYDYEPLYPEEGTTGLAVEL